MKKKNKITLVSITSIIIIVSFSYYFIDFPSENKGEIVGSWEILMKYTGPDYMRWVNIWTFNENGTLYYYQGYPYDTSINIRIPQIYFHQNMTSNELTVVEADNYRPSGNVYTREKGNWSINGGKICIYLLNISECAKYSLSKNSLVIYLYNGLILEKTTEPEYDESLENNLLEWNDLETAVSYAYADSGRPNIAGSDINTLVDIRNIMIDTYRITPRDMETEVAFGIKAKVSIESLTGTIPIIPSQYLASSSGSKSIYFLDLEAIQMRVLQDMTYEDLARTNDSQKFMLKMYEALVMKATSFNASITEIE